MESIYYTQQALLIGCTEAGGDLKSLTDVRRLRNILKTKYNYECILLENPI